MTSPAAPEKSHTKAHAPAPWWWPDQRSGTLIGLFILTGGILWVTRPIGNAEPSEFFKVIAQAVVLTGFLAAVAFLFNASKGASEANERADKALNVLGSVTDGSAKS